MRIKIKYCKGFDFMKYNFDTPIDRRGSGSHKWNVAPGELPMWVADMDFQTAPEIREVLRARVDHGVFGYADIPQKWASSYTDWWQTRHGLSMDPDHLIFSTGVISSISSIVRKLTTPAEKVILQTPVYNTFFNSILNNGRTVLENPLIYDEGGYRMDLEDLEKKLSDPQASLMILCNPHNPVGKIWDRATLAKIGELCKRHGVILLSDEIHCDLCDPGTEYIPFASVSDTCREISITCIAPTKAFNLAGIQTSAVYVFDPVLRHKVWRGINTDEVGEPNAFAMDATIAAFTKGAPWLDELRAYIAGNKEAVHTFIKKEKLPVTLHTSPATYLLWLDCSEFCTDASNFADFLRATTGLYLNKGEAYGSGGKCFLRMNVACPRSTLFDGLDRLKRGIEEYKIYLS